MNKAIYLIRHGESHANVGMGSSDDPALTIKGEHQARLCSQHLSELCGQNTIVLSSPFKRCILTVKYFAEHMQTKIHLESHLHEMFARGMFSLRHLKLHSLKTISAKYAFVADHHDHGPYIMKLRLMLR